ncbi:hypothetical protein ACHAXT_002023 [Thalassiosira profunda]
MAPHHRRRRRAAAAFALLSAAAPTSGFGLHRGRPAASTKTRAPGDATRDIALGRAPSRPSTAAPWRHADGSRDDGRRNYPRRRRREVLSSLFEETLLAWAASATAATAAEAPSTSIAATEEPRECRDGRIVSETAVPGAYSQTCMSLDERLFRLKSTGDTITIYQGTNAAGGMAGRTGVAVWNSGILLMRLLDALSQANPSIFKDQSVVELGCGTGLASIAAAKLGAASVLATDSNPEVLALARRNIERNNVSSVATTAALQWGLMDATEYEGTADVIIGSDLTYNSGSWLALAETMTTLLKPGGVVIYLTLGHPGFNVGGELGGFLSVAQNAGLTLVAPESAEWTDRSGGRASADDVLRRAIAPEERSVVEANGGVRAAIFGKRRYGKKG